MHSSIFNTIKLAILSFQSIAKSPRLTVDVSMFAINTNPVNARARQQSRNVGTWEHLPHAHRLAALLERDPKPARCLHFVG